MAAKPLVSRGKGLSDRPQTCGLRARFPDCLSAHRFAGFDGQQSGRESIFLRKCKHLLPKNTRNDVHAVISDESFVLPILCQCSGGCERTAKVLSQPLFLVAWLSVFLLALYHLPGMNRCPQFDTARNRFFFSSHENFFILLAEGESI